MLNMLLITNNMLLITNLNAKYAPNYKQYVANYKLCKVIASDQKEQAFLLGAKPQ